MNRMLLILNSPKPELIHIPTKSRIIIIIKALITYSSSMNKILLHANKWINLIITMLKKIYTV